MPSARAVARAAVVLHGRPEQIGAGLARLESAARDASVELVVLSADDPAPGVDVAIVLGGDGTMLRALQKFLGTGVPVIGVNFGRVGFLSSIPSEELEAGVARVFAGATEVVELATLDVEIGGRRFTAVNDAVITSAELGRMVEIEWAIGGEDLGRVPCDGLICTTPSGSTAYNLSNGGPVLMWGLDAMAVTFVAPHNLHARPLVIPRGRDVLAWNRTADVSCAVLVDGHRVADAAPGDGVAVRLGEQRSLFGTLPEATFVSRYRHSFAH
ncbi:putative sugar kinase [Gaiella occulta]|uniref:NAD kinase n=1 Tax=Gaiella occulta TaxID=1002870 RepID=A0A7M2YZ76_9ACTN|nr:NAD(+)/NADH kinase [Gaiella occulta]RDI75064.1 putative sugar kinase [Gaiella occulta]